MPAPATHFLHLISTLEGIFGRNVDLRMASIMSMIAGHKEISLADLHRITDIPKSTLLRYLQILGSRGFENPRSSIEALDLIESLDHPADARLKLFRLTSKGSQAMQRILAHMPH